MAAMSRAVVAGLVVAGCYDPRIPEGAPCVMDRECPTTQHCVQNACMRGNPPDDAATGRDADLDAPVSLIDAPPPACPAFALLCDDFESGTTAKWGGKQLGMGATVAVDGTHPQSGLFALDGTVPQLPSGGAAATVYANLPAAQSSGVLAVREWIYAPQPLIHYDGVVLFYNAANGNYAIAAGDDQSTWVVSEQSSAGLHDHHSTVHATDSAWVCVEQDYVFAGASSKIRLYVDDQVVIDATAADPTPAFTQVQVGVARAASEGFRVFVDDVVVATQHIGCH